MVRITRRRLLRKGAAAGLGLLGVGSVRKVRAQEKLNRIPAEVDNRVKTVKVKRDFLEKAMAERMRLNNLEFTDEWNRVFFEGFGFELEVKKGLSEKEVSGKLESQLRQQVQTIKNVNVVRDEFRAKYGVAISPSQVLLEVARAMEGHENQGCLPGISRRLSTVSSRKNSLISEIEKLRQRGKSAETPVNNLRTVEQSEFLLKNLFERASADQAFMGQLDSMGKGAVRRFEGISRQAARKKQ